VIRVEQRWRTDDRCAPMRHPRQAICTMLDRRMRLQPKSLEVAHRSASAALLRGILMSSRWLHSGSPRVRRFGRFSLPTGSASSRLKWVTRHSTQACAQAIEAVRSSERITLLRLPDGAISRLVREITAAGRVAVRQLASAKCVRACARNPPPIIAPSMRPSMRPWTNRPWLAIAAHAA
jgi:hypothetical protein